jgi:hypothetical protein
MPLLSLMRKVYLFAILFTLLAGIPLLAGDIPKVVGQSDGVSLLSPTFTAAARLRPALDSGAAAQTTSPGDTVTIVDIFLRGNKRTRDMVVFREMTFGKGRRIAADKLDEEIALTYSALMNTALFVSLEISYTDSLLGPGLLSVYIDIRETWYIYPVPVFSLADRNFNVWWRDEERSLDRVNAGGKLTWYNFTGRRDRFKVGYTTGFTREYEAGYRLPYLNKSGSIGINLDYSFRQRREQNYETVDNQQSFYKDENAFVYKRSSFRAAVSYRRKLYVTHEVNFGYSSERIADTIAQTLNPEFFGDGRNEQSFFSLAYRYNNDTRDVRNYPWRGHLIDFSLQKEGLGITGDRSGLTAGLNLRKFWPLSDRLSINVGFGGKYSLIRTRQPFLENRAIGFQSNGMVGYQFYVVDGLDMAIWRFGVRRQLFDTDLDLGQLVFIDAFRYIPLRLLASFQFNQGIANAPFAGERNELSNTLLTGASLGLDLVLFYDMVVSAGYYYNHLGEGGTLISFNLNF